MSSGGPVGAPPAADAMPSQASTPAGRRLLRIAQDIARDRSAGASDDEPPALSEFVQTYREWITGSRRGLGTQQQQAERWQLILRAVITADTIEQAIQLLIRFGKVVWGDRGASDLRIEGDVAELVFAEPFEPGAEGLVAAIWPLALTLRELEFLANARLNGVIGQVRHSALLPQDVTGLLFGAPLRFETQEVALVFPRSFLRRPVVARPADLPEFFRRLLPLTLGARRDAPSLLALTSGLIREDKLQRRACDLASVAARLAMSSPTLRRKLKEEGASFRTVKEAVYVALAQDWLRQRDIPIEEIGDQLGYSDSYAFRRFFRRLTGTSPAAFRRAQAQASDEV